MLAIAREHQEEQRADESLLLMAWPNLREREPDGKNSKKSNHKSKDLPVKRNRREQARRHNKDGPQKRANSRKRRDELLRTEKFRDPGEGPVVPVEAGSVKAPPKQTSSARGR